MPDLESTLGGMRARVEAATEGPWNIDGPLYFDYTVGADQVAEPVVCSTLITDEKWREPICAPMTPPSPIGEPALKEYLAKFDSNATFIAHARTDLPKLLAAVDAVVALHTVDDGYYGGQVCEMCDFERWPCPTIRALNDALGVGDE